MGAQPRIALTAAAGLVDAIRARGGDPDRVLSAAGLDRAALSEPERFIPSAQFARLLAGAAQDTGDPCFGLHFGAQYQPKTIGPLAYVVLNSPTFGAAFDNVGRYLHVHNEAARVTRSVEGPRASLRLDLATLAPEDPRQHAEYSLAVGLQTARLMAGSQWVPVEVQFAHKAPHDSTEHLRVFGCAVSFQCESNALVVERELLDRAVPAADPKLYPIIRRYLDAVLEDMPPDDGELTAVRRAIVEAMRDGEPTLARVVKRTGDSPRTLQRHLARLGLGFKQLVDDTRHRSSLGYLRNPEHSLTEIAYLLGYSEVSAFNRAFRRWTQSTPSRYRARHGVRARRRRPSHCGKG